MILIIDNYDSFTYNLAQYFGTVTTDVEVIRNDKIDTAGVRKLAPERLVISPGPGRPETSGNIVDIIRDLAGELPILGVCLGHQAMGHAFGGDVVHAPYLMHGKVSSIKHDGKTIFKGVADPFIGTRYHSLVVKRETLPDCFEITAETDDGIIMGMRRKDCIMEGVQFHPESLETKEGMKMIENFMAL